MNAALVATFTDVAESLLDTFGAPATLTHGVTTTPIQAVLESALAAIGEYGELMESRHTLTVLRTSGAVVGDTVTLNSAVWRLAQLIEDDGFVQKFAARN